MGQDLNLVWKIELVALIAPLTSCSLTLFPQLKSFRVPSKSQSCVPKVPKSPDFLKNQKSC